MRTTQAAANLQANMTAGGVPVEQAVANLQANMTAGGVPVEQAAANLQRNLRTAGYRAFMAETKRTTPYDGYR